MARRHVLLVEDIVDSGLTAKFLVSLKKPKLASVAICTLLSKSANRQIEIEVQYLGFEVPLTVCRGRGVGFLNKNIEIFRI